MDDSAPLSQAAIKKSKTLLEPSSTLYYARTVIGTLLTALSAIASGQANIWHALNSNVFKHETEVWVCQHCTRVYHNITTTAINTAYATARFEQPLIKLFHKLAQHTTILHNQANHEPAHNDSSSEQI
jgi:hypothetical protein